MASPILISVIIPTVNRATLLQSCLESLADQTISKHQYEIIVVDDGSTDATPEVCQALSSRMQLRHLYIDHAGIAEAKNIGIAASSGSLLLFADDDDISDTRLLEEHIKTHRQHPDDNIAVLGYTTWAQTLQVTPVMEWVSAIGFVLFGYEDIKDGQMFDFEFFWGGRSSCKRSLLVSHGVFNKEFRSIIEDIELGYRLSKQGLRVVFNRHAANYMIRPIAYDDFCERCERQGRALFLFNQLHQDPVVEDYCRRNIVDPVSQQCIGPSLAKDKWRDVERELWQRVRRVHELELLLGARPNVGERDALLEESRSLYRWTFDGFKMKGVVEAERRERV